MKVNLTRPGHEDVQRADVPDNGSEVHAAAEAAWAFLLHTDADSVSAHSVNGQWLATVERRLSDEEIDRD